MTLICPVCLAFQLLTSMGLTGPQSVARGQNIKIQSLWPV